MTKEQVTKKLKALKALAEQGVGGEKEDARRLYEKLKNKYGISEKELRQEPKDPQEKQQDRRIQAAGGRGAGKAGISVDKEFPCRTRGKVRYSDFTIYALDARRDSGNQVAHGAV